MCISSTLCDCRATGAGPGPFPIANVVIARLNRITSKLRLKEASEWKFSMRVEIMDASAEVEVMMTHELLRGELGALCTSNVEGGQGDHL